MKKWYLKEDFNTAIEIEVEHLGRNSSREIGGPWVLKCMLFDSEIEALDAAERQAIDYLNHVKQRQVQLGSMKAYHKQDVIDDFRIQRNHSL